MCPSNMSRIRDAPNPHLKGQVCGAKQRDQPEFHYRLQSLLDTMKRYFAVREQDMRPSEALALNRAAIRRVVESHRARNARVFGSVLHGRDTESSDLDILIDPTPDMTLFDIGAIRHELGKLLGMPVDVLTPNALPDNFRETVLAEASPV